MSNQAAIDKLQYGIECDAKLFADNAASNEKIQKRIVANRKLINSLSMDDIDWSTLKPGTKILINDSPDEFPGDWRDFDFYCYIPDAVFPIVCVDKHRSGSQDNTDATSKACEALIAYKYGKLK